MSKPTRGGTVHQAGRAGPNTDGQGYWVNRLEAGASRQEVAQGFWESTEHRGQQVDDYYATYLGRAADPEGRQTCMGRFSQGKRNTGHPRLSNVP